LRAGAYTPPPMVYLLLFVICGLHFSQLLRLGQQRSYRTMAVVGVNYVLAAAVSAALMFLLGGWAARGRGVLLALGAANGVLFVVHVLVMMASFRVAGTGITWAFVSSGVVIPVLAAFFFWGEEVNAAQWTALGLVPAAVLLLRPPAREESGAGSRPGLKGDVFLALCLLIAGAIGTLHKAQDFYVQSIPVAGTATGIISPERLLYQAALFVATAIVSLVYMAAKRMWPERGETFIGLGVGAANTCGLFFTLLALSAVGATVFFPTSGCLVILGNSVAGRIFWRERLAGRQRIGLAVALAIVVLANLRAS